MDPILVINAACSSVKFQAFGIDGTRKLERLIRGEIDGIGTQPRLRAAAANGEDLIDQAFPPEHVADVPAALTITEDWLREIRNFEPIAVGHRVVHGGPTYDQPVWSTTRSLPISNAMFLWRPFTSQTTSRPSIRFMQGFRNFHRSPASIWPFTVDTTRLTTMQYQTDFTPRV
jgi:acetate kinase